MAAPITKLRIGLQPDTPEEHTRLLINVNTEAAQTSLQIATDLRVRANPATAKIYYYNFDGSELLYTETIEPGGNGSWDGEPGRASGSEDFAYFFTGWALAPNSTDQTADARNEVFTTRTVFAAYIKKDIRGFLKFEGVESITTSASIWTRVEYSFDASTWEILPNTGTVIVPNGEILMRGRNNTKMSNDSHYPTFVKKADAEGIKCSGSIEFLLDYEKALAGEQPAMAMACFQSFFRGCPDLISAPELPVRNLASNCYQNMFRGCLALVSAPALPATTLAESCYQAMFYSCTLLRTPPDLPAASLATSCYQAMFNGCSSIESVPRLTATELPSKCYSTMFGTSNFFVRAAQSDDAPHSFRVPSEGDGTALASDATKDMAQSSKSGTVASPAVNVAYFASLPTI